MGWVGVWVGEEDYGEAERLERRSVGEAERRRGGEASGGSASAGWLELEGGRVRRYVTYTYVGG